MHLSTLLAAVSLTIAGACAAADRIPVENFFGDPAISFVRISPSGRYVAMLVRLPEGKQALAVRETGDLKKVTTLTTFDSPRMQQVAWINDKRLTFTIKDTRIEFEGNSDQFAIDRDGSSMTHLISGNWGHEQESTGSHVKDRTLTADYIFDSVTHDGSDDIIVDKLSWNNLDRSAQSLHPYRLNTRTRMLTDMVTSPVSTHTDNWLFDAADTPRVATATDKGRCIVYYRKADAREWNEIDNHECLGEGGFNPVSFDGYNTLYVQAGYKGRSALFAYDVNKRQLGAEPIVDIAGFDFSGHFERDYAANKILGIHLLADAASTEWLDPTMKAIQGKVDAFLPGTNNRVQCGHDCRNPPAVLVTAVSDRTPASYYIYTPANGQIIGLGGSMPGIEPKSMGRRDFVRFAARDGLQVPVYITRPVGAPAGPLPAIVLVHGGPYVRGGSWEWDNEAQFLASRGYLVLQPEFRGSTGFGTAHFKAGWKQWGRAMQDDLADTATWAVKQGWADPKRIGIMGASYGGYATLMGLARDPELFKVGVEWVGVTDIGLLFTVFQSDMTEEARHYGMKTLVGDPDKDEVEFSAVSPLALAGKIKQPLLMGVGAQDRRVPIVHASKFHDAVVKTNKNVEYVVYPEEGHSWHTAADRIDFWKRVDAFLGKNM
jgi:dienelactone hydrolase